MHFHHNKVNPVYRIIKTGKPFVYFHTLLFNKNIVELARQANKSLEIDISMDHEGKLFVGHPMEFYEYKRMLPPPHNLPIEDIVEIAREAGLYLVLDCKDVRALPWVKQLIQNHGTEKSLFHSWLIEFQFRPYAPEIAVEPHWKYEDLPLEEVLKVKQATGVPIISAARGLTSQRLTDEPEIVDKIIEIAAGKIDAINFNLPNGDAPPKEVMQRLLDNGLLTWLNIDKVAFTKLPPVFLGISDHLHYATDPKKF